MLDKKAVLTREKIKTNMLDKKAVLSREKIKRNMFDKKAVLTREKTEHKITFQISHYISDFVLNSHKRVVREIIIMSDLNKVVLCLEKIKSKNQGQNPDNLKHFLLKDFNCDSEDAIKLPDEDLAANIIKSVIFNVKIAYRIVRADFVGDDTVLVPETQETDDKDEHVSTVFLEEGLTSQLEGWTPPEHQK